MENKEILAAARKEKYKGKEFESRIDGICQVIGNITAILVASVLFVLDWVLHDHVNYRLLLVITVSAGAQLLFSGIREKKKADIAFGIFGLVASVWTIIMAVIA